MVLLRSCFSIIPVATSLRLMHAYILDVIWEGGKES